MIGGVAALVALIGFIVAHEGGHYFAAKATGMKVTEFFIGFGPRIWSFRRGETEYGIKGAIPFGAYVKVIGMNSLEEVPPEEEHRTYRSKPFWAKSLVVLSGVAANFLIAFLIFAGVSFTEGSPVIVDGEPVLSTEVAAVVDRTDDGAITAAAAAGLRPGDVIVAIDGRRVAGWDQLRSAIEEVPGQPVELLVRRGNEELAFATTMGSRVDASGREIGFLGFAPAVATEEISLLGAGWVGVRQVGLAVEFTFVAFGRILRFDTLGQLVGGVFGGEIDPEVRPVSPIGIVQIGSQAEDFGIVNMILLMAFVNVILGTLNALPLYPLDGGHFAVAVYEKVSGRTADMRKLVPVAVTVIALIALIGVLAIVLDIVSPIDL